MKKILTIIFVAFILIIGSRAITIESKIDDPPKMVKVEKDTLSKKEQIIFIQNKNIAAQRSLNIKIDKIEEQNRILDSLINKDSIN